MPRQVPARLWGPRAAPSATFFPMRPPRLGTTPSCQAEGGHIGKTREAFINSVGTDVVLLPLGNAESDIWGSSMAWSETGGLVDVAWWWSGLRGNYVIIPV